MSDSVHDPDAITFATRFYATLAEGQSVSAAHAAARGEHADERAPRPRPANARSSTRRRPRPGTPRRGARLTDEITVYSKPVLPFERHRIRQPGPPRAPWRVQRIPRGRSRPRSWRLLAGGELVEVRLLARPIGSGIPCRRSRRCGLASRTTRGRCGRSRETPALASMYITRLFTRSSVPQLLGRGHRRSPPGHTGSDARGWPRLRGRAVRLHQSAGVLSLAMPFGVANRVEPPDASFSGHRGAELCAQLRQRARGRQAEQRARRGERGSGICSTERYVRTGTVNPPGRRPGAAVPRRRGHGGARCRASSRTASLR